MLDKRVGGAHTKPTTMCSSKGGVVMGSKGVRVNERWWVVLQ